MRPFVFLAVIAAFLAGCGRSGDTEEGPIGSGGSCEERLADVVDERHLLDEGVEIREDEAVDEQIADAIEAVCDQGPASLSIGEAGDRVVALVRARTTSH